MKIIYIDVEIQQFITVQPFMCLDLITSKNLNLSFFMSHFMLEEDFEKWTVKAEMKKLEFMAVKLCVLHVKLISDLLWL